MDLTDIGWIVVVLSGIIWNMYRRVRNLQDDAPPSKRIASEVIAQAPDAPPDTAPAPATALAPVPRMSSGTRGPGAPAKTLRPAQAAPGSQDGANAGLKNKQNLRNALILREVLGEPRSKQPWHPGRKGR